MAKRQGRFDTPLPLRFALCAIGLMDGTTDVHRALAAGGCDALEVLATGDATRLVEHRIDGGEQKLVDGYEGGRDAEEEQHGAEDVGHGEADTEAGIHRVEDGDDGDDEEEADDVGREDAIMLAIDAVAGETAEKQRDSEQNDHQNGVAADDDGREDGGDGDEGGDCDGEVRGDGDGKHC